MSDPTGTSRPSTGTHVGIAVDKLVAATTKQTAQRVDHPIRSAFISILHVLAGGVLFVSTGGFVLYLGSRQPPAGPGWLVGVAIVGVAAACFAAAPGSTSAFVTMAIAKYKDFRGTPTAPPLGQPTFPSVPPPAPPSDT